MDRLILFATAAGLELRSSLHCPRVPHNGPTESTVSIFPLVMAAALRPLRGGVHPAPIPLLVLADAVRPMRGSGGVPTPPPPSLGTSTRKKGLDERDLLGFVGEELFGGRSRPALSATGIKGGREAMAINFFSLHSTLSTPVAVKFVLVVSSKYCYSHAHENGFCPISYLTFA